MKIKAFVAWHTPYQGATPELSIHSDDYEALGISGYSQSREVEIDIGEQPEFDRGAAVASEVAMLRNEKGYLLEKVAKIDDRIAILACIEYKPEAEDQP